MRSDSAPQTNLEIVPPEPAPVTHRVDRIEQLDSLRGLACLVVFLGHSSALLVPTSMIGSAVAKWISLCPTRILLDGHSAVLFFFLLSGFVLYLPFEKRLTPRYGSYLVRRTCRIYLPYLVGIAYAAAVSGWFYRPVPNVGSLFAWQPHTLREILHMFPTYASLILPFNRSDWNSSTWTLAEEMRISIFFPALAFAVKRWSWKPVLAFTVLMPFAMGFCERESHHFFPFATFHYASIFIVGSLLAKHRGKLVPLMQRSGWPLVLAGLVLITYGFYTRLAAPNFLGDAVVDLTVTAGNAVLLLSALGFARFKSFLLLAPLRKLGAMSYSFYLFHMPTLFLCVCLFWARTGPAFTYLSGFVLTVGIAIVAYRWIELPSIWLGRKLTQKASVRTKPEEA